MFDLYPSRVNSNEISALRLALRPSFVGLNRPTSCRHSAHSEAVETELAACAPYLTITVLG